MENAGIEREMRQRCKLKITTRDRRIGGWGLLRFRPNQNAGRIFDGSMEIMPAEDADDESNKGADRFQRLISEAALMLTMTKP